jgi:hypothetical protein
MVMKKQIRNKIKSLFTESLGFPAQLPLPSVNQPEHKDPYGTGPCPHCGEFAKGTFRHIGAPVFCENNHYWNGTCGHPSCANTPLDEEKLKGGLADNKTLEDIAKHHKVDKEHLKKQWDMGLDVEKEHTDSNLTADEIVKDHLWEDPNYYTNLKNMEGDKQLNEMPYFIDVPDKNGQPLDLQIEKWETEEDFKNFLIKLFSTEFYKDEKQPSIEITDPEEFVKILTNYDGDLLNPTTQFFIQFIRKYRSNGRKITTQTVAPEDLEYVKRFVIDAYNKSKDLIQ